MMGWGGEYGREGKERTEKAANNFLNNLYYFICTCVAHKCMWYRCVCMCGAQVRMCADIHVEV